MDTPVLYRGDYSSDSAQRISGTIYSDRTLATAFDLTGYTLTLRLFEEWHRTDQFDKDVTINVAASGTWYYNIASSEMPYDGLYLAKIELSKSGTVISTLNRVEVLVKRGPTA